MYKYLPSIDDSFNETLTSLFSILLTQVVTALKRLHIICFCFSSLGVLTSVKYFVTDFSYDTSYTFGENFVRIVGILYVQSYVSFSIISTNLTLFWKRLPSAIPRKNDGKLKEFRGILKNSKQF